MIDSSSGLKLDCLKSFGEVLFCGLTSTKVYAGAFKHLMVQSPKLLWGEATGTNPTDRAKKGTKRSLLVEGNGLPAGLVVDGANVHDGVLAEDTFDGVVAKRPKPESLGVWNFEADKGYDSLEVRFLAAFYGYVAHIPHNRRNAKQVQEQNHTPTYHSKRWIVERTHSWLNRFRRLLVRWEKKKQNYLAMLHLACAYITYHAGGFFG